jgi:hypothetical protein
LLRGENSPHESCLLARSINLLHSVFINSNLWGGIPTPFAIQGVRLSIIALPGANNDLRIIRVSLDSVGKLAVIPGSPAVINTLIDLTGRHRGAFNYREAGTECVPL